MDRENLQFLVYLLKYIINLDLMGHQILNELAQKVQKIFPQNIYDISGKVDRSKIRELLLRFPDKIFELESVVHPILRYRVQEMVNSYNLQGWNTIIDGAILVDLNWSDLYDYAIFIMISDMGNIT